MSAPFTVRKVEPNNGLIKVHLSRDVHGQQEDIWMNVVPGIEAHAFMEGDARGVSFPLISRAGSNGQRP